jgi:Ca2+-binding EF-hand superfamily protein
MELMGETLTDQDIDNMIALADLNKDGKIDYEGK